MATCRGIDVSAYQSAQDWTARKAQGVVFAFAKASEGQSSRDSRFATHISGIKAAGLIPGAYHFAWPNQDPSREATNYITAVKPYAGKGFCHWLDLERYSDGRNYSGRTASQILAWVKTWLSIVEAAFPGQRVGIYTSADDIAAGHVPTGIPLWYPAYPGASVDTFAEAEAHAQPRPSGRTPLIWQFTSDPAGTDRIDESIAYMSATDFRAWAQGDTQASAPPKYEPFPGASFFRAGRKSPIIAAMHKRLVAVGCGRYKSSANADTWGSGDVASYAAWQRHLGYTGSSADGIPGPTSWAKLHVPNV